MPRGAARLWGQELSGKQQYRRAWRAVTHATRPVVRRGLATATAACIVSALLLTGACGKNNDSGTTNRVSPAAQARFATDLEQVAASYRQQTQALQAQARAVLGQSASAQLPIYESLQAAVRTAREKYRGLRTPKAFAARVDHIVNVLDGQDKALTEIIDGAKANRGPDVTKALQRLSELLNDFGRSNAALEQALQKEAKH
ncbi:MAG: hypothetical protein QOK43_2244 [Acidimicrobiaceae bacterium]|nr:hypothetical protein [Acidimicrobiaceae bacterium]